MMYVVLFDSDRKELGRISGVIRDQAALLTEDRWNITACARLSEAAACLEGEETPDAILFDVTVSGSIPLIEKLRFRFEQAYIILIAAPGISPVLYMKPTIMAASLLLKPVETFRIENAMAEMLHFFMSEKEEGKKVLILEDEEGRIRIAYRDIYYFEARNKKIYACTMTREYGFYDTLERLEEWLPEEFVRCHRGFIVNSQKIKRIALSEGSVFLEDGYEIPLSRSYRQVMSPAVICQG